MKRTKGLSLVPFAKKTRDWRSTLPTDGRGHLVFNAAEVMHIELGMPTAEDCRQEEIWQIESLMSRPPVPLSNIGYAHRKNMSARGGEAAAGARRRKKGQDGRG